MPEKNLIDSSYAYLLDSAGEYIVVTDAITSPLVTPNPGLTSRARHVLTRSTGATVVARSSGKDVFTRGGTQPLATPKAPLIVR